jgi:hypothetical protein
MAGVMFSAARTAFCNNNRRGQRQVKSITAARQQFGTEFVEPPNEGQRLPVLLCNPFHRRQTRFQSLITAVIFMQNIFCFV